MPIPLHCPNPACLHFEHPPARWKVRFGSYATLAHGTVNRYRCSACGRTFSDQTESMHYFAKRRLPPVCHRQESQRRCAHARYRRPLSHLSCGDP